MAPVMPPMGQENDQNLAPNIMGGGGMGGQMATA